MAPPGGAGEASEGPDWEYMIVFIQRGIGASRFDILQSPLIPLNSTFQNLQRIQADEISGRMASMLGGAAQPQRKSSAESLLGPTPTFKTREEYEAYLRNKGID